jgi:hypothetical protein
VVKTAVVRSNGDQVISAWSRGTVVFKGVPEDQESESPVQIDSMRPSLSVMKLDIKFE